jgi:putative acetyltransferase
MNLKIRQETKDNFNEISEVNRLAFGRDNEAKLVNQLRYSDAFVPGLSLIATIDDKIVGHILFTKIKIVSDEGNEFDSLALAPITVRPEYQRKGIGGHLIRAGLEKAKESGFKSVILLGHKHYYPKFGFVPADKWDIKPPFDVPADVFMGLELVENGLKNISGTVKYPKEFENV